MESDEAQDMRDCISRVCLAAMRIIIDVTDEAGSYRIRLAEGTPMFASFKTCISDYRFSKTHPRYTLLS